MWKGADIPLYACENSLGNECVLAVGIYVDEPGVTHMHCGNRGVMVAGCG